MSLEHEYSLRHKKTWGKFHFLFLFMLARGIANQSYFPKLTFEPGVFIFYPLSDPFPTQVSLRAWEDLGTGER